MLGFDDPFLIEMVPFEETLVNFWEVYRNRILCWSIPSFTNRDFFGTLTRHTGENVHQCP